MTRFIASSLAVLFFVTACTTTSEGFRETPRYNKLAQQISQFQSDPEIVDFLTREAARAGVSFIKPFSSDLLKTKGGSYGTSYPTKRQIYLNQTKRGGGSVVNITHEIAHVAARHSIKCGCHTQPWLKSYLKIAERFEARFPGVTWSGTTPTKRVLRNATRYNIKL